MSRLLFVTLLTGIFSSGAIRLCAAEAVAISSTAAPGYVRPMDAAGKPKAETYIVMQGHVMGSPTIDGRLARMTLADVLKTLAGPLAKQSYFPARDPAAADLTIIVHWGSTQIYEDPRGKEAVVEAMNQELAAVNSAVAESGISDASGLNRALSEAQGTQQSQEAAIARNAALLGFDRALARERRKNAPSAEEITMLTELNEERYFVVLMAYDYKYAQREHKPRLLWVTRLSVRSPGTNFTEALPTLTLAGAEVFGRQLDGLVRLKAGQQVGQVKLGELQILGAVENPAAAKAGK